MKAWLMERMHCCKCGFPMVVLASPKADMDYWWYCANPECQHHSPGEHLGDMEEATFARHDRGVL